MGNLLGQVRESAQAGRDRVGEAPLNPTDELQSESQLVLQADGKRRGAEELVRVIGRVANGLLEELRHAGLGFARHQPCIVHCARALPCVSGIGAMFPTMCRGARRETCTARCMEKSMSHSTAAVLKGGLIARRLGDWRGYSPGEPSLFWKRK